MFQRIKNLEFMYGDNFLQMIKPYCRRSKRTGEDLLDEPPSRRTKLSQQNTVVDKDKLVSDLQAAGYTKEEAEKSI